ncbi:MAG: CapA family protein [Oscillospiraceae bacterium]|nr:CapA family protein [Oscillospiraceae bacterium]
MPEEYRSQPPRRRRRRKKGIRYWSAKRWKFELTRLGVLLALILIIVLLFRGCKAAVNWVGSLGKEDEPPAAADDAALPEDTAPEGPVDAEPEGPTEVSLIMVGDVLLHDPLQESGLQADGSYNYDHFFAHTSDLISRADLALVNQEVILGGKELGLSGYPAFNGAYEVGDALVKAGFDVVLHATNHALDKGETGLLNCVSFWENSYPDIAVLGIHGSEESKENNIYYYEVEEATIAILNYTYGTNGIDLPLPYMVDLLEEDAVIADLQEANANADFVIAAPHWGLEYTHTPSDEETRWAQLFLENGVDLVLGTHPHVIQPVEWLEDESGNKMLVYYSLGNFINFTSDSGDGVRQRAVGAMAEVTLAVEDGAVSIADYGVTPLIAHMVEGTGSPTVYAIDDYTQELAAENAMSQKDSKFSLAYCQEICDTVFGDLWRN